MHHSKLLDRKIFFLLATNFRENYVSILPITIFLSHTHHIEIKQFSHFHDINTKYSAHPLRVSIKSEFRCEDNGAKSAPVGGHLSNGRPHPQPSAAASVLHF